MDSALFEDALNIVPLLSTHDSLMVLFDVPLVCLPLVGATVPTAILDGFLQNDVALIHHIVKYTGDS